MRNKSEVVVVNVQTLVAACCVLWLCAMQSPFSHMHVNAVSVTKGLQQPRQQQRVRAPKIADLAKVNGPDAIPMQQQQQQQLPPSQQQQQQQQQQQDYNTTTQQAAAAAAAAATSGGKYEIRSVSGEPSYKSVNLTWEVEFVPSSTADAGTGAGNHNASTNGMGMDAIKAFQVYFCEIQAFGPHRCRFKTVDASSNSTQDASVDDGQSNRQVRHYAMQIDNLRMATTYSFHVRPATNVPQPQPQPQQQQQQLQKRRSMRHGSDGGVGRRADAALQLVDGNELDNEVLSGSLSGSRHNELDGQTIVIPTKGFSAEATRCLPHASEIEVQTGPYFGGKIVVDGGNCGVKGNPDDAVDTYTMRIDHKMCGSLVKPETNTVETFITVQENLGIYTHSTRRFVVVCSFQSGMQTVRASFTVPGRGGVAMPEENDPFIPDDRSGRELSGGMRYVDKSALVLKEDFSDGSDGGGELVGASAEQDATSASLESEALVHEIPASTPPLMPAQQTTTTTTTLNGATLNAAAAAAQGDTPNAMALLESIQPNINEWHIKHENDVLKLQEDEASNSSDSNDDASAAVDAAQSMPQANYAKLVLDRAAYESDPSAWYRTHTLSDGGSGGGSGGEERTFHLSTLHYITAHMGNVLLAACASVIIFVVFIVLVIREVRRQRKAHALEQKQQQHQKYDM